jgi:hypothetical protein
MSPADGAAAPRAISPSRWPEFGKASDLLQVAAAGYALPSVDDGDQASRTKSRWMNDNLACKVKACGWVHLSPLGYS